MPARIKWKDIAKADRDLISQAVNDAIGRYEGDWRVKVSGTGTGEVWEIRIDGPEGFVWSHRFTGAERAQTIIANSARAAVEMAVGELSHALAELIRQGITFTTQPRPDGGTSYVINRAELSEEEVTALARQGALTRDGLRSYLLSR